MRPDTRTAVVGVDFTEMGDDAIREALVQIASGALDDARFVYVLDPDEMLDDPEWRAVESVQDELLRVPRALRQRVRDIAAMSQLPCEHGRVHTQVRTGRAVATLIDICLEQDADLLIVGTHARPGLDCRLLGPVADALVRLAPCPVLVARPKAPRASESEVDDVAAA